MDVENIHLIVLNLLNNPANKTILDNYHAFLRNHAYAISVLLQYLQGLIKKEVKLQSFENVNEQYIHLIIFVFILLKRLIESETEVYYSKSVEQRNMIREFCVHFACSKENPWRNVARIIRSAANLLVTYIKFDYEAFVPSNFEVSRSSIVSLNNRQEEQFQYTLKMLIQNECPYNILLQFLQCAVTTVILSDYSTILNIVLSIIREHQLKLQVEDSRSIICMSLRILRNISIHSGKSREVVQLLQVLLTSPLTNEIQIEGYELFGEIIKHNDSLINLNPNLALELILTSVKRESKRFVENIVNDSLDTQVYNLYGEAIDTEAMCFVLVQLLTSMVPKNFFEGLLSQSQGNMEYMENLFYHVLKFMQVTNSNVAIFFESPDTYLTDEIKEFTLRKASIGFFQELLDYHGDESTIAFLFLSSVKKHLLECISGSKVLHVQQLEGSIFALGSLLPYLVTQLLEDKSVMMFIQNILQFSMSSIGDYVSNMQGSDSEQKGFLNSRLVWFVSICFLNFPSNYFPNSFIHSFWNHSLTIIRQSRNSSISYLCVDAIATMILQQGMLSGEDYVKQITSVAPVQALDDVITAAWSLMLDDGTVDGEVPKLIMEPLANLLRYYPSLESPTVFSSPNGNIFNHLFIYFSSNANDSEITECMLQITEQLMFRNAGSRLLELSLEYISKFYEDFQRKGECAGDEVYAVGSVVELLSVMLFQCNDSNDTIVHSSTDRICSLLLNIAFNFIDDGRLLEACQESLRILLVKFSHNFTEQTYIKIVQLVEMQLRGEVNIAKISSLGRIIFKLINTFLSQNTQQINNLLSQLGRVLQMKSSDRLYTQSLVILVCQLYLQNLDPFKYLNVEKFCTLWIEVGFDLDPCAESSKRFYVEALTRFTKKLGQSVNEMNIFISEKQRSIPFKEAAEMVVEHISASYEDKDTEKPIEQKFFADWIFRKYCIDEEDPTLFDDPLYEFGNRTI